MSGFFPDATDFVTHAFGFDPKSPGKKDGIKQIVKDMETLQNYIDRHHLTSKTSSVIDTIKKMRRAMHENRVEYYTLPETSAQASEYLFLYETSGGEELDKQVSFNYGIARLNVRTKSLNTKDVRTFMFDIDRFVKENLDPSIKVEYTGVMSWVKAMADYVGQKRCFILAFSVITCMIIIVLRSFKLVHRLISSAVGFGNFTFQPLGFSRFSFRS